MQCSMQQKCVKEEEGRKTGTCMILFVCIKKKSKKGVENFHKTHTQI